MPTRFKGNQDQKRALNAFIKLLRAAETVTVNTGRTYAGEGLTARQFGVLEALYHLGPLCQRDIARKILKSSGNITTVVDNLEKRGLVTRRRGGDRRFMTVHLTEAGKILIAELFPRQAAAIAEELAILSPEEQDELARLCRKLGRKEKS